MELSAARERVLALLLAEFPVLRGVDLRADTPLVSGGLLDSFAIVSLVALLDAAFGCDIDVASIDVDCFETPDAIAALCVKTLDAG